MESGASGPRRSRVRCGGARGRERSGARGRAERGPVLDRATGADRAGRRRFTLDVATAAGYGSVDTLKKVQLKTFAADGSLDGRPQPQGRVRTGRGREHRPRSARTWTAWSRRTCWFRPAHRTPTYVLHGEATTLLRPDLVVATSTAPLQTLTTRPVDLVGGDRRAERRHAANATVTLLWGPSVLGTRSVTCPPAARSPVDVRRRSR